MADSDWIDDEIEGDWVDDDKLPSKVSQLESGARGLAQGASLGFADEITGGTEALWEKAKGDPTALSDLYRRSRDESRSNYQAAQAANPGTYGTGEVGGAIGTMFIPGLNAASGAKLAALAGKGAMAGGIAGLGTSKADLLEGDIGGALTDTVVGGTLGGALGLGAGLVGAGASKLANSKPVEKISSYLGGKLDDFATGQSARALGAERGTIKKLGADKIREIGRYGLDNEIVTPLASTDDMIARNEAIKNLGADKMNSAYSAIDDAGASTFNPLNVATKVDEELGGFYRSPINRGETKQLENTLESILMRGDGNIPLSEAQALKQELGKVANWKNNINVTDKERMAREAYGIVSSSIDEAAASGAKTVGKEGLLQTLQQGKSLYGNAKGAEDLLSNRFAREQGNQMFGLTDTIAGVGGVGAMGPSGLGILGAKKVFERFGNQSLAVGANNISEVVKKAPQMLGKFANVLKQAEQRGPQGVASTHFILQQNNPEYRQMLQRISDEREQ